MTISLTSWCQRFCLLALMFVSACGPDPAAPSSTGSGGSGAGGSGSGGGTGGSLGTGGQTGSGGSASDGATVDVAAPDSAGSGGSGSGSGGSTAQDTASDTTQPDDAARDTLTDGPHTCNDPGFSCPGNQVCQPLQGGSWSCFPPGIEP